MSAADAAEPQEIFGFPKLADQFAAYDAAEAAAELREHVDPLAPYGMPGLAEAGADLSAIFLHDDPGTDPALPPLAPMALGDKVCEAVSPDGRWNCVAHPDHEGDHVPYGAAGSEAGLRALTWPQDGAS